MMILKILLSLFLYLVFPVVLAVLLPGLGATAATGLGELIALPILLLLYEREQRRRQHFTYAPRFLKGSTPGLVMALGAASCIGLNSLITLSRLDLLFPAFSQEIAAELYAPPLYQQLLFLVLIIPTVEELVFRGTVFALIANAFHGQRRPLCHPSFSRFFTEMFHKGFMPCASAFCAPGSMKKFMGCTPPCCCTSPPTWHRCFSPPCPRISFS